MSENLLCPLKFNLENQNNTCISNCAWNAGSKVQPRCALMDISFALNGFKDLYELVTLNENEKE